LHIRNIDWWKFEPRSPQFFPQKDIKMVGKLSQNLRKPLGGNISFIGKVYICQLKAFKET
jgi:hypothetical protein